LAPILRKVEHWPTVLTNVVDSPGIQSDFNDGFDVREVNNHVGNVVMILNSDELSNIYTVAVNNPEVVASGTLLAHWPLRPFRAGSIPGDRTLLGPTVRWTADDLQRAIILYTGVDYLS
jgi:hypothetical protein